MYCTIPTRRPWYQRLNQPAYRAISADYTYQRMFRGQTLGDRQLAALKPVKSRLESLRNLTPARNHDDNPLIPDEIKRYRPELQRAYLLEIARQSQQN
jgi:hypothetical protein